MQELRDDMEQLKRQAQRARNYALAKRTASWPLDLREWTSGHFGPNPASMQELTPLPLPRIFGSYPSPAQRYASTLNLSQQSLLPPNQKSIVDHHPLLLNPGGRHPSVLGFNPLHRTKDFRFTRTMISRPFRPLTPEDDSKGKTVPGSDPRPPAA